MFCMMMKGLEILTLSLLIWIAQVSSTTNAPPTIPDMVFNQVGSIRSRKLKEDLRNALNFGKKSSVGNVDLEDYYPADPVLISKASLRPGPIQHGTPLIPYIPIQQGRPPVQKPSPPGHPKQG